MNAAIQAILTLVESAELTAELKKTLVWGINQLPMLCQSFSQSYESKYAERILSLEQHLLVRLAEERAPALLEALLERLQSLHELVGLPTVAVKTRSDPKPAGIKKRKTA